MTTYVGVDNGVSGSIGILVSGRKPIYIKMPVFEFLDYPKTKEKWIHRIEVNKLFDILHPYSSSNIKVFLERPMVNPMAFNATMSGIRAFEATLIVIEKLDLSKEYLDSKEWQREMLPAARKTKVTKSGKVLQVIDNKKVKKISLEIGKRIFPKVDFTGFKDADGLLIAEYCRRNRK